MKSIIVITIAVISFALWQYLSRRRRQRRQRQWRQWRQWLVRDGGNAGGNGGD